MRLKIKSRRDGPVSSEAVITINTELGQEDVVVHKSQVTDQGVEVGIIAKKNGSALIELPRETVSGRWRVWVPTAALV
jgi:hypothetical protein